jgi:hypothetical protein
MQNDTDASMLDNDPELKLLLDKGASVLACRCFAHWIRGFEPARIGLFFKISEEEVESNIALVKRLLPNEVLASQVQIRNEITAAKFRRQETAGELSNDLCMQAEVILKHGRNPAHILKRYRESVGAEDPTRITALRKQNNHASINENAVDLTPEDEGRLLAELRGREKKPAQKVVIIGYPRPERKPSSPEQKGCTINSPDQKPRGNRTDRRVTLRLNPNLYGRLEKHSQDIGVDLSSVVRAAIANYLSGDPVSKDKAHAAMPPEALALTGRYQVAGSDLKEKLRENFLQLLAMAHVTSQRWPRAGWVRELYLGLASLYCSLGAGSVRQD